MITLAGWLLAAVAAAGWLGLLLFKLRFLHQGGHQVDDSYMFYRYAQHIRQGLGMSWNPDGVPTYGMTTLLWTWVIVPFSMLPVRPEVALSIASWTMTGAAILLAAAAIWKNAESPWFRFAPLAVGAAGLSAMSASMFDYASASGMETMLGFATLSGLAGMVLLQRRQAVRPEWIGLLGFAVFLSRPEGALPAGLMILCAALWFKDVRWTAAARSLALMSLLILLTLGICKLYFGTPLPLPFYVKAAHGYRGYRQRWYPFTYGLAALRMSTFSTLLCALFAGRRQLRMLAVCLVPVLAIGAYLSTVTQIMGFHERYFVPYMCLLVIAGWLTLDEWLATPRIAASAGYIPGIWNFAAVALVVVFFAGGFPQRLVVAVERHTETNVVAYRDVVYDSGAKAPPPAEYFEVVNAISDELVPFLPKGTVIAASEVGKLGMGAPQVNIIDLAGLNDRDIAVHGFNPDALLARKPDMIWLPHVDYTWQRGVLLTDPALLARYDLYAGAFNYGLAVRKDSPAKAIIDAHLPALWAKLYPGHTPAETLVHSVTWPGGSTVPPVDPPPYEKRTS